MNKIIVFHDQIPAHGGAFAARPSTGALVLQFRPKPPRGAPNLALRATWRRSPGSGRLECRWAREHGTVADNEASHRRGAVVARIVVAGAARRASLPSR